MKVVCFSEIQWKYVKTRKQQILGRFPENWEILFLSSVVRGKHNNFTPERDGRITHVCVPALKHFPQRPLKALFAFPPARFLWNLGLLCWVRILLAATGFGGAERIFFVSNIYYASVLPFLKRRLMLYDCNDDPMEFPDAPSWAERYFIKLARTADVVVAVSRGLVERLRETGVEGAVHIGNGVDYDLFVSAASAGVPEEMGPLPRPILGYSGAIAMWFDMELLATISASFPDASIVLMGPLFEARRDEIAALAREHGNIHYLGVVPYERLGAYQAALDVCLIPLRMNELMRLADPNKLYEYAAVEKPIVTYRFTEEMDEFAGFVYLARNRDEFIDRIKEALEKGADMEKLRDFARSRSWKARADQMVALILRRLDTPNEQ